MNIDRKLPRRMAPGCARKITKTMIARSDPKTGISLAKGTCPLSMASRIFFSVASSVLLSLSSPSAIEPSVQALLCSALHHWQFNHAIGCKAESGGRDALARAVDLCRRCQIGLHRQFRFDHAPRAGADSRKDGLGERRWCAAQRQRYHFGGNAIKQRHAR